MLVKNICVKNVVVITPSATILDASILMKEAHVGELVVCDSLSGNKSPVGVLTDRDIVFYVVSKGVDPDDIKVEDIMVSHPVVAHEDEDVDEVIRKLRDYGIRRIPVVNEQGHLKGIISVDDLMKVLVTELSSIALVSDKQIFKEKTGIAISERF